MLCIATATILIMVKFSLDSFNLFSGMGSPLQPDAP
jgi:hypothetical protein